MAYTTTNDDTGSLKTSVACKVGDRIKIAGENKERKITYIMGKGEKQHLCCKGAGPFPTGTIEFEILAEGEVATVETPKFSIDQLKEMLAAAEKPVEVAAQ